MKKLNKGTLLILAGWMMFLSSPVLAESTAREIITSAKRNTGNILTYVSGVEQGLGWANSFLQQHGQRLIYCQPTNLSLTSEQIIKITQDYVQHDPKSLDDPFGLVFRNALIFAFPCK